MGVVNLSEDSYLPPFFGHGLVTVPPRETMQMYQYVPYADVNVFFRYKRLLQSLLFTKDQEDLKQ